MAYAQSGSAPVSVSAPKPSKGKKHELQRVSIDVLDQGFMGRCSYSGPPTKDGYPMYEPDKEYALNSAEDAAEFVKKALGVKETK